jgi:hypothetical protein
MRNDDQRKAAERACATAIAALEAEHACRIVASVRWNPIRGMSCDVKPFAIAPNGQYALTPQGQAQADTFMARVMAIVEYHQVALMPRLEVVGETSTATYSVIGFELTQRTPTDDA